MYGKPNIEPPSYDLPPPSYDEVMKSNKIWIIFIFEFLKRKLSFGIFVLAFALEGFKIRKTSLIGRHCLLSQFAWIAPLVVPFKPSAWAYFVFRLNIQPHPFVLSSLADVQMILTIEYFCNHFNPNIFAISGALFTLAIQYEFIQTQFEEGARDVNNIWVTVVIFLVGSQILLFTNVFW